ncbi:MAG: hypothetical protein U0794_17150 [Isosphaeraceae bacterium]
MRVWVGLVIAAVGLGGMIAAHGGRRQPGESAPWARGMIVIDPPVAEKGKADAAQLASVVPSPGRLVEGRVRFLAPTALARVLIDGARQQSLSGWKALEALLSPKLYELAPDALGLSAANLRSGRLPEPGRDEVLAGPGLPEDSDVIEVEGRKLEVVGRLAPDLRLLDRGYLIPPSDATLGLFREPAARGPVHRAEIVSLARSQLDDSKLIERLDARYPPSSTTRVSPVERLDRGTFLAYLGSQALLVLGGSGALLALYRALARRPLPGWLRAPFEEIDRRPRWFWAVHLLYFGLFFVGTLFIYELPDIQTMLTTAVRQQLQPDGGGVLAVAGKAYGSRNIAYAAGVTFLVNYFLGTLAQITVPSLLLPGIGAMMGVVRPILWGVLLGPIFESNAGGMIPHSITLLLEGEGYVLAFAFGLLVPYYLVNPQLGPTLLSRLRQVVLLNVKASALVAIVLAVAAIYEAIEIIAMMG